MSAPPENPTLEPLEETPPVACPRCGTGADAAQEYCLECGLRLPRDDDLPARLGAAWQRRLSWYPGDWLWPVLALIVIAAVGAAVAILSTGDSSTAAQPTVVPTRPVNSAPITTTPTAPEPTTPTAPEPTVPAATVTAPRPKPPKPKPKPRPKPKPTPTAAAGLTAWPARQNGYTLVLGSIPKPHGLAAALAAAHKAKAAGLPRVGVLDSSRFSSLHPGYFVVFSGVYDSFPQANNRLGSAHAAGFGVAYPRAVTH